MSRWGWLFIGVSVIAVLLLAACGSDDNDEIVTDGDSDLAETETAADGDGNGVCFTDLAVGEKEIFYRGLVGSEGIAFDGIDSMFVTSSNKLIKFTADATMTEVADAADGVGATFGGNGDLLVCSFGPLNDDTRDGGMYKYSNGQLSVLVDAGVIANANFVTRTPWGSWLISDDMIPEIWELTDNGETSLWTEQIPSPNGMVFSPDGNLLYVASTFENDSPLYVIPIEGQSAGTASVFVNLPENGLLDGLAMDKDGNVYVMANGLGKIVRVTPEGDQEIVAEGLMLPASGAFGAGEGFDPCSLYVTELIGSKIWRISLGTTGNPLYP